LGVPVALSRIGETLIAARDVIEKPVEMASVASSQSLNKSMEGASKHYSSLFFLPTFKRALTILSVVCICFVGLSTFPLFRLANGLACSLAVGVSLFVLTLFSDYLASHFVLKQDPIFVIRRTVALSLFCWILWLSFIVIGVVLSAMFGFWLWIKLCLLGFCAVTTLRAVVFFSASSVGLPRSIAASLLQPLPCIMPFLFSWGSISTSIPIQVLPFLILSPFLCLVSAYLFVSMIDRQGRKAYGIPSMKLFKAFMQNWVVGLNEPIEKHLENLGQDEDIEVSFLEFASTKPKATIIVPTVHPGPFKNIGSSLLPSLLKSEFEREHGGEACVPLGIIGHELDLASQEQNHKIVTAVLASAHSVTFVEGATPFFQVSNDNATANCQVFGKTAFLSFTLAPKTTEDLPQELSTIVREQARKVGLDSAVIVNTHNSLTNDPLEDVPLEALRDVASRALDKAASTALQPFQVGAATVYPREFSLADGMGQGGITAIAVRVAQQEAVYVIIDGNNLVSGLREKLLSVFAEIGFEKAEIFTTDTHAVSAVVLGKRGYHPVGEAMDHDLLAKYLKEAATKASGNLEPCKAGCLSLVVPKVRVIGKSRIHSLSTLVDLALQKAKQVVVPIFAVEGLLLVMYLAVL